MKTFLYLIFLISLQNLYSQAENLSLDTSFGQNGTLELNNYESILDIKTDESNNIYVLTSKSYVNVVLKLFPNGEIDMNFGVNGEILSNDLNNLHINKISLIDNYLYLASTDPDYIQHLSRYNLSGEIDLFFGNNGVFKINPTVDVRPINIMKFEENLLLTFTTNMKLVFCKLSIDGVLDESFGNDGLLEIEEFQGSNMAASALGIKKEEDSMYIHGDDGTNKYYTVKYNENFGYDLNYGTNGKSYIVLGTYETRVNLSSDSFVSGDYIYISGNVSIQGPPRNYLYAIIHQLNKNTGEVEIRKGYSYGDPDHPYGAFYYGGLASLLYGEDKMIIGGRGKQDIYGEFTRFYMTDFSTDTTIQKEFDFLADYKSFVMQGDSKMLAAGSVDDHFFISCHNLNENMEVEDALTQKDLFIYPNPTQNVFNINSKHSIREVKLYNENGQLLKSFLSNNGKSTSYNIEDLKNGVYFVSILFENREQTNRKLVINK